MSATVGQSVRGGRGAARRPPTSLYRRLLLFNAAVVVVGALVLMLSPVTVSDPVLLTEVAVLAIGGAVMVAVNAILVRATLRPRDRLSALMERVDLLRPGERLSMPADRDVAQVIGRFNEMLDRLEQERGVSSAHALAAQEGERQRIARELHDEIGQSLTAALVGLKRTADRAPADLRDELHAVQETIRGCLDEVRMVARRLRPGVLEDLGLRSAVAALANDFTTATRLPVDVAVDPRLPALDANTELVLYRIAQEGLTNVARHADAGRVEVTLVGGPDAVELTITDNGRGIDPVEEGAGIRGMRERAIMVAATLSIGPAPGAGTRLRLVIPTDRAASPARPNAIRRS
ncbi:MAG TPA: sensor histidine kinase [Nakamurella sp.]|jgi:two-component system sensor histidine kinase UhpB